MTTGRIDIPPGIVKRDPAATAAGRWVDAQWVRFRHGRAEKIGGWQAISSALTGLVRGMLGWTSEGGSDLVAAGTASKLYSIGDGVDDITPLADDGTLTDPFSTTNLSAIVTVTDVGHGLAVGATAVFSGATAVGGITIDGAYLVATVVDTDNYTIVHSAAATSTAGPGGGTVGYEYEINPGLVESSFEDSFLLLSGDMTDGNDRLLLSGDMQSGTDCLLLSGDVGRFGVLNEMRYWWLDTYGNTLLALPSGGTLYQWDQVGADPRAEAVANAPTARAMFVTSERFPFLLGTDDPMKMEWPDQDDITQWTPAANNTANARTLQGGSKLMAGANLSELINIIWSDTTAFLAQYTGSEYVYDTRPIADGAGLSGPGTFTVARGSAYWLSKSDFLMYSGGLSSIPNSADIRDFVIKGMDQIYAEKNWCGYNPKYNEVWWGYVSAGATEPDRYVMVALDGYQWSTGTLTRTAASYNQSPTGSMVMAGQNSIVYRHEVGLNGAGLAIESFVQSGLVALKGGGRDTEFFAFIPDLERQVGDITVNLKTFENPRSQATHDEVNITVSATSDSEDTRLSGRYVRMKLTSNVIDGDYRLGVPLLETEPGGER